MGKRLPLLRVPTEIPEGPRIYRFGKEPVFPGGPGQPPPGFLMATNSVSEWIIYWGLGVIFGLPKPVRQPPFQGASGIWGYQIPASGGRHVGGSVIDFVVWRTRTTRPLAIRIQTEYFHLFTMNRKQIDDLQRLQRLSQVYDVFDLYDYTYTDDPSGQKVIQVLKGAIGMIQTPNPLRNATARRNGRTGGRLG